MFANVVVEGDRVDGLSLPHLAFGDLREPGRLDREPIDVIQYIYDSKQKNLLCRDVLDENRTVTEMFANNQHYASITWYSTRRYAEAEFGGRDWLSARGDQFKLRLSLSEQLTMIMKPDIVYFPDDGRDFLAKSSSMILPADLVAHPLRYAVAGRPLVANETFSLAYLSIASDGLLTIVHKRRFSLAESLSDNLERAARSAEATPRFMGRQGRQEDGPTMVTRLACPYAFLVPERG